jgi:hypothetical protein
LNHSNHYYHIPRIVLFHGQPESFDSLGAAVTQGNEEHLILLKVYDVIQSALQPHKVYGGQPAEEDRVLSAEAEVLAGLGHLSQSFRITNVIGHKVSVHASSPGGAPTVRQGVSGP